MHARLGCFRKRLLRKCVCGGRAAALRPEDIRKPDVYGLKRMKKKCRIALLIHHFRSQKTTDLFCLLVF